MAAVTLSCCCCASPPSYPGSPWRPSSSSTSPWLSLVSRSRKVAASIGDFQREVTSSCVRFFEQLKRCLVSWGICMHLGHSGLYLWGWILYKYWLRPELYPDLSWASLVLVLLGRVFSELSISGAAWPRTLFGFRSDMHFSTVFE